MEVERLGIHSSVEEVFPPSELAAALADVEPSVSVVESAAELANVDAVVTFVHDDAFLEHVDWVHSIQAGYDRFPVEAYEERGVLLTNSSGVHLTSVGETVAGYMLSFARRLHTYRDSQQGNEWNRPEWDDPFTLADEPVTVVGLGALGQGVAECAAGLGMSVSGVRRKHVGVPHVRDIYTPDALHDAIRDARFVVITVPLTPETEGMFGPREFEAMRDDAYLVNVARGGVVQQDALVETLQDDGLAGAALDVFETEPLPEDSPLWDMDEVIVTPHAAAADRAYHEHIAALVRRNVAQLQTDGSLVNRVW